MKKYIKIIKIYTFLKKFCKIIQSIFQYKYAKYTQDLNIIDSTIKNIEENIYCVENDIFSENIQNIIVITKKFDSRINMLLRNRYKKYIDNINTTIICAQNTIYDIKSQRDNLLIVKILERDVRKTKNNIIKNILDIINLNKNTEILINDRFYNINSYYSIIEIETSEISAKDIILLYIRREIINILKYVSLNGYLNNKNANDSIDDIIKLNKRKIIKEKIK